MRVKVPNIIKEKCNEFVNNFKNPNINNSLKIFQHNNTWKESEENLIKITKEIFNVL